MPRSRKIAYGRRDAAIAIASSPVLAGDHLVAAEPQHHRHAVRRVEIVVHDENERRRW
jgi:hypothetical protein